VGRSGGGGGAYPNHELAESYLITSLCLKFPKVTFLNTFFFFYGQLFSSPARGQVFEAPFF
jgi:hypothetical protein